jgi:hypothetical protein
MKEAVNGLPDQSGPDHPRPAATRHENERGHCDSPEVRRSEFRRILVWMVLLIGLSISP